MTAQQKIKLKIVGQDNKIEQPTKDGFRIMRLFAKGKAIYYIRKDEEGLRLMKKFKDGGFAFAPLEQKYLDVLNAGGSVLIDTDIVVKA